MKPMVIVQEVTTGCGIAYVANIVGMSYTDTRSIAIWENMSDLALLSIKHHVEDERNFWHWVVFKRVEGEPYVLDSASYLESNIRQDFKEKT